MGRNSELGQELLDRLNEGVEQLVTGDDWRHMLDLANTGYAYSFGNLMLAMLQGHGGEMIGSYRYWQSVGRQVRKGQKAIHILRPMIAKRKMEDPETGETIERQALIGFSGAPVFGITQTDGPDLPKRPPLMDGVAPAGLLEAVVGLIEAEGFTFDRGDCGGAEGYTLFEQKKVRVSDKYQDRAAVGIALHELAHIMMMTEEERRDYGAIRACRGKCEVEAQSVSYVVTQRLGLEDDSPMDFYYVAHWSNGDVNVVRKTGTAVLKTAAKIIEGLGGETKYQQAAA